MKKLHRLSIIAATVALFAALLAASAHAYALSPLQMRMMRASGGMTLRASGVGSLDAPAGYIMSPEKIVEFGGKLYGLASYRKGYYPSYEYAPSEVFEFDADLKVVRSVKLEDGANKGLNALDMEVSGGKLYVVCVGGNQNASTFGDVWTVDTTGTDMTAKRVLAFKDAPAFSGKSNAIPYGIEIGAGGAAYLLVQIFETFTGEWGPYDMATSSRLFVTTLANIEQGKHVDAIEIAASSSNLLFDRSTSSLLLSSGGSVEVRSASGAVAQTISAAELGNNAYSLAALADGEGIFYTAVDSSYTAGSTGKLTRSGSAYAVTKGVANLGGDIQGFAYKDAAGTSRVIVRETPYGGPDTLYAWKASDIAGTPDYNSYGVTNNIHSAVAMGGKLYLACYNKPSVDDSNNGEFVVLDTAAGYARAATYPASKSGAPELAMPALPNGAPASVSHDKPQVATSNDVVISGDASASLASHLDDHAVKASLAGDLAVRLLKDGKLTGASVKSVVPLPLFTTSSTSNGFAAVSFNVSGSDLGAGPASNVQVIKIKSADMAIPFTYSTLENAADYKDGVFSVVLRGGAHVSNIVSGGSYTLTLIIRDNGDYDLCKDDGGVILDPAAIVTTDRPSGTSSGGCGVGAFGLIAAGLAVALLRKK